MNFKTKSFSYDDLMAAASKWAAHISSLKSNNPPQGFTWYGYDILANLWHMNNLLKGGWRDIFTLTEGQPIADIGAADGDLGYFFNALGWDLDIIDWPQTNWNGLRGARYMKELLGADVNIFEVDLDSQFNLPRTRYGVIFLFGILYHLKNPFYVLEKLAHASKYCFVSTRIARQTVDGAVSLDKAPLAYLLSPDECNNDATNYWIFSMPGLERLANRCGWRIVEKMTVGDTVGSNPSNPSNDERAFLLLESSVLM